LRAGRRPAATGPGSRATGAWYGGIG
jgi:hypothetical protein